MILSDKTILKMLAEKTLVIEPLEKEQIQPASVDIRLGNTFSIVEDSCTGIINLEKEVSIKRSQATHIYFAKSICCSINHCCCSCNKLIWQKYICVAL